MPTSVHIPPALLEALDRKARALRVSRNRLIVRAIEREMARVSSWSEGFFERLNAAPGETSSAVDEMLAAIEAGRRSKRPREL
jgi:predicted transcriptional regulator